MITAAIYARAHVNTMSSLGSQRARFGDGDRWLLN